VDSREKILHKCNLDGKGLEVGPSYNPIVPKRDGYDVETIDHLDKKGLQEKYAGKDVDLSNIEEVDYVWSGELYTDLTGKKNYYDYIIASHVIEHTNDLVGFLKDCSNLLKENGILSLVVPDKRFSFDYLRPVTGISRVIERHLSSSPVHSPGTVYEHVVSVCVDLKPEFNIQEAVRVYNESLESEEYFDAHNWIFTQNSFELIIYDLNCLGLIDLKVAASFETSGHEFFVSLEKRSDSFIADDKERMDIALRAQHDNELILRKRIDDLEQKISEIYNSKTWKTGEKIQKLYRMFVPGKSR